MKLIFSPFDIELLRPRLSEYQNPAILLFLEPIRACIEPDNLDFKIMLMEEELIIGLEHVSKSKILEELKIPVYVQSELPRALPQTLNLKVILHKEGIEIKKV